MADSGDGREQHLRWSVSIIGTIMITEFIDVPQVGQMICNEKVLIDF
jgi:hypothetical protein